MRCGEQGYSPCFDPVLTRPSTCFGGVLSRLDTIGFPAPVALDDDGRRALISPFEQPQVTRSRSSRRPSWRDVRRGEQTRDPPPPFGDGAGRDETWTSCVPAVRR